jgi:ferrochelatase
MKKGILLVNLGTPDSPSVSDVRKYLDEFLMDPRVIDIKTIPRNFLVRGAIIPFRAPESAKIYKKVWTDQGSPLLIYGERVKEMLQEKLGDEYVVELAMRYQSPSIETGLNNLRSQHVSSIQVIPLFPQYASASTGSVNQKVMEIVSKWLIIPKISFINSFHDHPKMIKIFADNGRKHGLDTFDHFIFSFHGLPERQMIKADITGKCCLKTKDCCSQLTAVNQHCYVAQCYDTARLLGKELGITEEQYTVSFQSRLGKEPWVEPFTSNIVNKLALEGKKRLLVFCPAFVADCLETLYEISEEYHDEFVEAGGELVQLVESLNDNPEWIEILEEFVLAENRSVPVLNT